MPRTIIDIPPAQLRRVDRLCRRLGISRAEAVRRGLDAFVQQNVERRQHAFGLWREAGSVAQPVRRRLEARRR